MGRRQWWALIVLAGAQSLMVLDRTRAADRRGGVMARGLLTAGRAVLALLILTLAVSVAA